MINKEFSEKSAGHSGSSVPKEFKIPADPGKAFDAALKAVEEGDLAFMEAYIAAGKDLNWHSGYSLLHKAMKRRDLAMAELLIKGGADTNENVIISWHDYERNASFCRGPLIGVLANQWHSPEMLALLLNAKPQPAAVNVRIKSGIDSYGSIDDTYINKESTLLYLVVSSSSFLRSYEERLQMTEKLLKAGADPNLPNISPEELFHETPLSEAIARGDAAMVKLLLQYGADVTKPYRVTPSNQYAVNTFADMAQSYFSREKEGSRYQKINELVQAAAAKQKKEEAKPQPKQSGASSSSVSTSTPPPTPGYSAAALGDKFGAVQTASRQQSPQPRSVKKKEEVVASQSSSSSPQGKK